MEKVFDFEKIFLVRFFYIFINAQIKIIVLLQSPSSTKNTICLVFDYIEKLNS